jgi:hypothetical protein
MDSCRGGENEVSVGTVIVPVDHVGWMNLVDIPDEARVCDPFRCSGNREEEDTCLAT